ncbi:hypothetical protein RRG08_067031 [Elysia crispata]|uniref:Uncharacterized protein n=1 Tax=Elysia crispata TaxID=231223 RepID=A0AAE1A1I6_9GAST|nr:hypothetical protein RRG08_067031 [Elysia crispata]
MPNWRRSNERLSHQNHRVMKLKTFSSVMMRKISVIKSMSLLFSVGSDFSYFNETCQTHLLDIHHVDGTPSSLDINPVFNSYNDGASRLSTYCFVLVFSYKWCESTKLSTYCFVLVFNSYNDGASRLNCRHTVLS